jgi:hypothetical protein
MLLLHRLKSPDGLFQAVDRLNPLISWPKNQVADPQARVLEAQEPLRLLSEHGKYLAHNICLEGLNGQAPNHGLSSRRHHSCNTMFLQKNKNPRNYLFK